MSPLDSWYAAMRSGDLESLRGVATPDIRVWWNGPPDLVPWAGEHRGVDAAIAFFRQVTGHLDVLRTAVVEKLETPDAVVAFLDAHWRVKASGVEIRAKAVNVFRFREGLVAGYEVYPDSAAFVRALAEAPAHSDDAVLMRAEPQLFVTDMERALTFWRGVPGFAVVFVHGDPPHYAQVACDGVRINLRHLDRPAAMPTFYPDARDLLAASITVSGIDALNAAFVEACGPLRQPLRTEPWGSRTFILEDPFGNLLLFAEG